MITVDINGRQKAFYRDYYNLSQVDLIIPMNEFDYISQNKHAICAIVFIPTASSVFLLERDFDRRHPSLSAQFWELSKLGIDVVIIEEELRKAAMKKSDNEPIWWSDDTHWNKNGMLIAAKTIANNTACVWDLSTPSSFRN